MALALCKWDRERGRAWEDAAMRVRVCENECVCVREEKGIAWCAGGVGREGEAGRMRQCECMLVCV